MKIASFGPWRLIRFSGILHEIYVTKCERVTFLYF
jgi:hypothetical protein